LSQHPGLENLSAQWTGNELTYKVTGEGLQQWPIELNKMLILQARANLAAVEFPKLPTEDVKAGAMLFFLADKDGDHELSKEEKDTTPRMFRGLLNEFPVPFRAFIGTYLLHGPSSSGEGSDERQKQIIEGLQAL
jgi:hypothetical protein